MDEKRIEAAAKAIAKVMYAHKDWNLLNIATQNISRNYARAAAPILSDNRVREKAQTLVNALDRCEDMIKVALMLADYRGADCTKGGKLTYGKELDALKRSLAGEGEQASPMPEAQDVARSRVAEEMRFAYAQAVHENPPQDGWEAALAAARKHDRGEWMRHDDYAALAAYEKGKQA